MSNPIQIADYVGVNIV